MLEGATVGGGTAAAPAQVGGAGATGLASLAGKRGVAVTDLRPAGKVEIDGAPVDAVTQAEFIGKGLPVEVMEVDGFRVVVRRCVDQPPRSEADDGGKP